MSQNDSFPKLPVPADPNAVMKLDLHPTLYTQGALAFQLMPPLVQSIIFIGKLCYEHFLSMFSLPLEVFLRYRWGLRLLTFLPRMQMTAFGILGLGAAGVLKDPFLGLFSLTAVVLTWFHYLEAHAWRWQHGPRNWRYTYANHPFGFWAKLERRAASKHPWLGLPFCHQAVYRFSEPALGFLLAVLLYWPSPLLASLLAGSALALLMKRHVFWQRETEMRWDQWDARALAEALGDDPQRPDAEAQHIHLVQINPLLLSPDGERPLPADRPLPGPSSEEESPAPASEVAPTQFTCPKCRTELRLDGPGPVERVECPVCQARIRLKSAPPQPAPSADPDESAAPRKMTCPGCRSTLRVHPSAVGRIRKCPNCKTPIRIEPQAATAGVP